MTPRQIEFMINEVRKVQLKMKDTVPKKKEKKSSFIVYCCCYENFNHCIFLFSAENVHIIKQIFHSMRNICKKKLSFILAIKIFLFLSVLMRLPPVSK